MENRRRLGLLIILTRLLDMPWLAIGDLNMPPHELAAWTEDNGVHIWKPVGATATCTVGRGRLLDYVLTSEAPGSDLLLEVTLATGGTWRAHMGVQCRLARHQLRDQAGCFVSPGRYLCGRRHKGRNNP